MYGPTPSHFSNAHTSCQTILWNTIALEAKGDGDLLNALRTKNTKTGEISDVAVNGLFYAIGHEPATSLIRGQVDTDSDGYIITVPGTTLTNIKGVFAAGDVQDKRYRQAITSAGSGTFSPLLTLLRIGTPTLISLNSGCMAALEAERLLAEEEEGVAE